VKKYSQIKTKNYIQKNYKTMSDLKEYTMGLRVKDTTCNEHITVAYLGKKTNEPLISIKEDMYSVATANPNTKGQIYGEDSFGPDKNIPVFLIKFNDQEFEKQLISLWEKYNVEQEHTKGLKKPNWHISKKTATKLKKNDLFEVDRLFVKELGPVDPCIYFKL
jgi:hypothetical protein